MSRIKSRQNVEVCGDCGASDATWASINKGILLCTQCCSIHRTLGRHISQVKSLQKSTWNQSQLNMVYALNNNGANNIWEYDLLENNGKLLKKKPNPKDSLNVKQDFIIMKHEKCAYSFRGDAPNGDGFENELGKQLHASVRSPNLEVSFRLLVQGADPNYFHDEKGSTPLHVAVKHNQKLQVELLLIYGADPEGLDNHRKTPIDLAKSLNSDCLDRLVESQYEVTDAFIEYLVHRKPDHQKGINFYIPSVAFESNPAALSKLQKMPNSDFEELVMDVFDEVDRRQTDASKLNYVIKIKRIFLCKHFFFNIYKTYKGCGFWLSCVDALELTCVPFLPPNCKLSSTRNQGRQKLGTFSTPELRTLVADILTDTQRRQMLSVNAHSIPKHSREYSQVSLDDDPLYDSVASDEETTVTSSKKKSEKNNDAVEQLTKQLKESDCTIHELKTELLKLKASFDDLKYENIELKSRLSQCKAPSLNGGHDDLNSIWNNKTDSTILGNLTQVKPFVKSPRPISMVERGEHTKFLSYQQSKQQKQLQDQARNTTQSLYNNNQIDYKETVLECTRLITRSIQDLWKTLQDGEDVCASGEKVRRAVTALAAILKDIDESKSIKAMCRFLPGMLMECSMYQNAQKSNDAKLIELHLIKVREYAFQLAKHTKEIVTKYSSSQQSEEEQPVICELIQ